MKPVASISIEKAADMLNIGTEELLSFCEADTECRYHHLTIYGRKIRFFPKNIEAIRAKGICITSKN